MSLCGNGLRFFRRGELLLGRALLLGEIWYNIFVHLQTHSIKAPYSAEQAEACHFCFFLNSLPNDKILNVTKLKTLVDDKFKVAKLKISLFDREENTGKRRKCWLPAFSPIPTVFSKDFFFETVENILVKGEDAHY